MRNLLTAIALTTWVGATPSVAQDASTVVELFTSQGCSSCPPADAMLEQLATDDNIIALSLHVDYWDYLGWTDDLASPAFTTRQKNYAQRMQARRIYTPQIVVDGRRDIVGSDPMKVMQAIAAEQAQPDAVALDISRDSSGLTVRAQLTIGKARQGLVQLVRYVPEISKAIGHGENGGKSLRYVNVVTEFSVVADWDMAAPLAIKLPVSGPAPVVVIVQDGPGGPILAAARLR